MDRAKAAVRRSLLVAGRTALGQRVLRFYADNGLVADRAQPGVWNTEAAHLALVDLWDRRRHEHSPPTLDELTELPVGGPPLDRPDLDLSTLTADQRHWVEHGFVIKQGIVPSELLDAYWDVRSRYPEPHGWPCNNAYQHIPEALEVSVYRPVFELIESLIGEPTMLMLNLTGSVSTERNWHQDDYLNAAYTQGWYAAAWFAIDDVDPDSGPYQYVPGSHRWPVLRRDRVRMFLDPRARLEPMGALRRALPRRSPRGRDQGTRRRGAIVRRQQGRRLGVAPAPVAPGQPRVCQGRSAEPSSPTTTASATGAPRRAWPATLTVVRTSSPTYRSSP